MQGQVRAKAKSNEIAAPPPLPDESEDRLWQSYPILSVSDKLE